MDLQVRLTVSPFLPIHQPALGVSSLLAVLQRAGIEADVSYYNLDYVAEVSASLHLFITKVPQHCLLGEMLFAKALWGEKAAPWRDYFRSLVRHIRVQQARYVSTGEVRHGENIVDMLEEAEPRLRELHDASPHIVGRWADDIVAAGPRVVGISTTFQQNNASLALAKELRRRVSSDRMLVVFGGANCDDVMGEAIAASFPFVDCVVSGEGEDTFLEIVERVLHDPNAKTRLPRFIRSTRLVDLNRLPAPNFDHYFAALSGVEAVASPNLVAETSRGCWFGAKSHCKFCGLNGSTIVFRRKNAETVLQELVRLAERYRLRRFMMADNILDLQYVQDLLPRLAEHELELFYEIKPNLHRRHLRALHEAGVTAVQPGIESLDSGILKLIAKGATKLQNVQTLRWCFELGIDSYWSILYGFPGESPSAYEEMADLIRLLVHLPPPMQVLPFQMHRFSPYFFAAPEYRLHDVRPYWSYRFAYPTLTREQRHQLAYCFEFRYPNRYRPHEVAGEVLAAVPRWDLAFQRGAALTFEGVAPAIAIFDAREEGPAKQSPISALEYELLLELGEITTRRRLIERYSSVEVDPALARFDEEGWTISEGEKILSLVVDRQWRRHATRDMEPDDNSRRLSVSVGEARRSTSIA
jgi:ribosomal peptide maturation radical SAM protein 1